MKIELTISTDTLGEYNTAEDNQRYADAVEDAFNALDSETLDRDRPYLGQPHTFTGERGKQEVFGVTMRDIRDIFF